MSHIRIQTSLSQKSVLDDPELRQLLAHYQDDPNFIKEGHLSTDEEDFIRKKAQSAAYQFFNINSRYNINDLRAMNKAINEHLLEIRIALDTIRSQLPEMQNQVEKWESALNKAKAAADSLDREALLGSLSEFSESFQHHLVTEWLKAFSNTNAYLLSDILKKTVDEHPEKGDGAYIQFCMQLAEKHGLDIRKTNSIPFSTADEALLKTIINDILKNKTPELFISLLRKNLQEAGLLQINKLSADEINNKVLQQQATTQAKLLTAAHENLEGRISTDIEIAFNQLKILSTEIIENMQDLQTVAVPLAIQAGNDVIQKNAEEVERILRPQVEDLDLAIKRHVTDEANPDEIDSTQQSVLAMSTALAEAQTTLITLAETTDLKKYTEKVQLDVDEIEKSLDKIRDISHAINEKVDAVRELPATFLNAYNTVIELANSQPGQPETDIQAVATTLRESQSNMETAHRVVTELLEMNNQLAKKDQMKPAATLLQENLTQIQCKLAIATVIDQILGNLDTILMPKKATWYTIGMQKKVDAIEKAREATVENMEEIINSIYKNLQMKGTASPADMLKQICDGVLVHGSTPNIQDQLEIKRYSLGKTHLVEKLARENSKMLQDKTSGLGETLAKLGVALQLTEKPGLVKTASAKTARL